MYIVLRRTKQVSTSVIVGVDITHQLRGLPLMLAAYFMKKSPP